MSQKKAKQARRESGISGDARRGEREFEQQVMALRLKQAKEWDEKPYAAPSRRYWLAWAWLVLLAALGVAFLVGLTR